MQPPSSRDRVSNYNASSFSRCWSHPQVESCENFSKTRCGHDLCPQRRGETTVPSAGKMPGTCLALHSRNVTGWRKIHLCISEGGILPPGMATLNAEMTAKPARQSAGQDARLYGSRDARRYPRRIRCRQHVAAVAPAEHCLGCLLISVR